MLLVMQVTVAAPRFQIGYCTVEALDNTHDAAAVPKTAELGGTVVEDVAEVVVATRLRTSATPLHG